MEDAGFWTLIDESRAASGGDLEYQMQSLRGLLAELSAVERVAFHQRLVAAIKRANTWDLIGAAAFVGCANSTDGFLDFRAWLVAQGLDIYRKVLRDVNSLADLPYEDSPTAEWYCEELYALAYDLASTDDAAVLDDLHDLVEPLGEPVELAEGALRERFPGLWKQFGSRFMVGISSDDRRAAAKLAREQRERELEALGVTKIRQRDRPPRK